ncbi:MAG: Gfo/Idh/MocA family oxidoreductase, partial [Alicyclobacillus sp.]|nr:Gfo/Idh/MocA family oxidoreductase [Alicyclobacillus sp.]
MPCASFGKRCKAVAGRRTLRFGVIGAGLMGKEFASAVMRWCHLEGLDVLPSLVAVCDVNERALEWFREHVPTVERVTTDYRELLSDPSVDAVYCALPHHLHGRVYAEVIRAGKHLMGEKPFGIDQAANREILAACGERPEVLVRCSSEFPFFPGAYQIAKFVREGRFGRIIEVEAGFWHSSDLNPEKPINWKRRVETNGAYGCMGDLGLHVVHLPFRFGWRPRNVRALLANIVPERPDGKGGRIACDTWDNALLVCEAEAEDGTTFPMTLTMKRIAPGHANTW